MPGYAGSTRLCGQPKLAGLVRGNGRDGSKAKAKPGWLTPPARRPAVAPRARIQVPREELELGEEPPDRLGLLGPRRVAAREQAPGGGHRAALALHAGAGRHRLGLRPALVTPSLPEQGATARNTSNWKQSVQLMLSVKFPLFSGLAEPQPVLPLPCEPPAPSPAEPSLPEPPAAEPPRDEPAAPSRDEPPLPEPPTTEPPLDEPAAPSLVDEPPLPEPPAAAPPFDEPPTAASPGAAPPLALAPPELLPPAPTVPPAVCSPPEDFAPPEATLPPPRPEL